MARELHTMVETSANPDQVWHVRADFDAWRNWNVADLNQFFSITCGCH